MRIKLTGPDGSDRTDEILDFAKLIGLDSVAPGRYSVLLVLGLFGGFKSGQQGPEKIISEISALEGSGVSTGLKAPTKFIHPPLKGLCHKHHLQDGLPSMALNLQKGLKKFGMPLMNEWIQEAQESGEERIFSEKHVGPIIADIMSGNWKRLVDQQALTGEWIIYAQHEGKNYYLCLGTHDTTTHEDLRRQIDAVCCLEFPFLNGLLVNA